MREGKPRMKACKYSVLSLSDLYLSCFLTHYKILCLSWWSLNGFLLLCRGEWLTVTVGGLNTPLTVMAAGLGEHSSIVSTLCVSVSMRGERAWINVQGQQIPPSLSPVLLVSKTSRGFRVTSPRARQNVAASEALGA